MPYTGKNIYHYITLLNKEMKDLTLSLVHVLDTVIAGGGGNRKFKPAGSRTWQSCLCQWKYKCVFGFVNSDMEYSETDCLL